MDPAAPAPQAFNPLMPRPQPPVPTGPTAAPPAMHPMNVPSGMPSKPAHMPVPPPPANPIPNSEPIRIEPTIGSQPVPSRGPEGPLSEPTEALADLQEANPLSAQAEPPKPEVHQMQNLERSNINGGMPIGIQAPSAQGMIRPDGPNIPIQALRMNSVQPQTGQKRSWNFEKGVQPGKEEQQHWMPGVPKLEPSGMPSSKAPRIGGPAGMPSMPPLIPPAVPPPAQHIDKDLKNAALRYLNKVKSRFEHQKDVYNDFLDIMKEFQSRQLDTPGVIKKVSTLFNGETELILGFNDFLPDGYKITERDIALHYPGQLKPMPAKPKPKQAPAPARSQANMKTPPELRYAQSYVSKIRKRFRNDREVYKKFLKLLQNYQEDQKSVKEVHERVKELFKGHPDLLIEFKQFLPDPPDPDATHKPARKSIKKPRSHRNEGEESMLKYKDEMEFFCQFKARMEPQQYEDFLKLVNLFNNHILSAMELMLVLRDLFTKPMRVPLRVGRTQKEETLEQPDLHNSLHKFVQMLCGGYVSVFEGKKAAPKGLHRPSQSTAGPSYMCRPQTTLPICSSRDQLCVSVLNDQYSLNPLGSEQTTVLTNTHEMALAKAEDERFELEMMVNKVEWSINRLEPMAEELSTLSRTEKQRYEIYDRLNVVVLRTVQKLYGPEHGNEVIDWLYDCPGAAVPIILARLKQREQELRAIQHEQHRIWVDVYDNNYHKALDHRSYAFKTHDKKMLHSKSILQAIKEAPSVHVYPTQHDSTQIGLWYVLNEVLRDLAGEDAAAITALWEDWLSPHLFPASEAKPSKTRGQQTSGAKSQWLLYGNQNLVSMFRLHQLLHSRMAEAKVMAEEQQNNNAVQKEDASVPSTPKIATSSDPADPSTVCATPKVRQTGDPFQAFISILLAMLRGQVEVSKYEDECRSLLGTYSYKLFTLDKLIPRFVKESSTLLQSEHWEAMKKGAEAVEASTLQPAELKTQMVQLFWHNCFEVDYTTAQNSMTISFVPMVEGKDISALTVAAADILDAINNNDDDRKESGVDEESGVDRGDESAAERDDANDEMDMDDEIEDGLEDEGSEDDLNGDMLMDEDDDDANARANAGISAVLAGAAHAAGLQRDLGN